MNSLTTEEPIFPFFGKNENGWFYTFVRIKDHNGKWWLQKICELSTDSVDQIIRVETLNLMSVRAQLFGQPTLGFIHPDTNEPCFYEDEFQYSDRCLLYAADDLMFEKYESPLAGRDFALSDYEIELHNYWVEHFKPKT